MADFQFMRLINQYEMRFGHRVNSQLVRSRRTRDGGNLEEALVLAMENGKPLPELAEKARWAPVTGRARYRLRQKRYRLKPRKRGWRRG